MARWEPPAKVGPNEHIGRRLFDEPMLAGAEGQNPYEGLDLRHFEETRDDKISLDRLGKSSVEKAVRNYLIPKAEAAAAAFAKPKAFNGWMVLAAKTLEKPPGKSRPPLSVIASPVAGEGLEKNEYHAHVVTPPEFDHYTMALHLRTLFAKHGKPHPILRRGHAPRTHLSRLKRLVGRMLKWVRG